MLFDVQAALSEILSDTAATIATTATKRKSVADVAGVAAQQGSISRPAEILPFAAQSQDLSRQDRSGSIWSPAVSDAVVLAFEDYAATDDPRDPRAWT